VGVTFVTPAGAVSTSVAGPPMERGMRGKRPGRSVWILRGALATLGLAGAVYAADQVTEPPPADVGQTITNQRIKQGELVKPDEDPEHQVQKLSPEQMIALVSKYETECKTAYDHGETTRIQAYRSRDIIRMTCIDDKLTQMKQVLNVSAPRQIAFPRLMDDELRMRQHFLVLQMARNRVMELAAEVEACMGDTLDGVTIGRLHEERATAEPVLDPTRPPTPTHDVERPPEASPYR
jgi:hypothetical protein